MKAALDTNILAYAEGANGAAMRDKAMDLLERLPPGAIVLPVQILGELFNAFNRVNYSLFNTQHSAATVATSVAGDPTVTTRNPRITITPRSDFGDPRAQFDYGLPGSARVGQLAAKFIF